MGLIFITKSSNITLKLRNGVTLYRHSTIVIILPISVIVNGKVSNYGFFYHKITYYDKKGVSKLPKTCAFGKAVKIRLIELERNQAWLIEEVRDRTGLYFDDSYLWKVLAGVLATPKIVQAIKEILDME